MSYLKWAYNRSKKSGQSRKYKIATTTAIEMGEVVKLVNGLVVAVGDTDQDDPYLGVAAEPHDGATAGRQSGTEILVFDHPDDVFALKPTQVITASGGSTTTFVVDNLKTGTMASNYDDMFNGGYLKLVSVAADSSLNGKLVKISDFNATNGTITLSETLAAAIAASDTAYLCPGNQAIGTKHWNLDSNGIDINWEDASAGECLRIDDVAPETFTVFVNLRLHQNANEPVAI
jgi:hypothetical protein